ncbi:MAG: hypothetical protein ACRD3F_09665 [Acidobacteriaceae bacterium]
MAAAAVALLWAASMSAQTKKPPTASQQHASSEEGPAAKIWVGPLGFVAPSPAYLSLKLSFNSLDFIDNEHLLFTFHVNALLKRIPGDPPDDNDQIIRAVVLDIKTGKVLQQADWRMHDRGRYLWALQDGTFLVRERNTLFLTDRSLQLRPYLTFDTDLEGVEVSPGRGLLMLEMKKYLPANKDEAEGDASKSAPPSLLGKRSQAGRVRTQMVLLRPGERTALASAEFLNPAFVPLLKDGLLDYDEGKKPNDWVISRDMLDKTKAVVGTVRSTCAPRLVTLSDDVALSQNCPGRGGSGTPVTALSLKGKVLWSGLWDSKYIWGQFESSEDGSRFAYESLEMNRPMGSMEAFGESDVVAQPVGVFDTRTGNLVFVKDASPILSAGQNFALSADGRRFAILRNGAIEVYDLPPVAAAQAGATSPPSR